MKRVLAVIFILFLLTGCSTDATHIDQALTIRKTLLDSNGCAFDASITADYGDKIYEFRMQCTADASGNVEFTVSEPETISGITGKIENAKGMLTFDDRVLGFELLADGQITPVSAPWLLVKTLRSGYLSSCCADGDGLRITIDDSYEEDALQLDIWTDANHVPVHVEILFRGKRILTIEVASFSYL